MCLANADKCLAEMLKSLAVVKPAVFSGGPIYPALVKLAFAHLGRGHGLYGTSWAPNAPSSNPKFQVPITPLGPPTSYPTNFPTVVPVRKYLSERLTS